jgi:hypothetical protein
MRILLTLINFRHLTGSEMYVYELSRSLVARGHDVTVVANAGGLITEKARAAGVTVYDVSEVPAGLEFDVTHVQQFGPARWALASFPDTPVIATVHSQFVEEKPVVDPRVHKYVCIRPEIREKVVRVDGIPLEKTAVIFNGLDRTRFGRDGVVEPPRPLVLFVGTVDPLRRQAALHLIERSQREDFDVLFVGARHSDHLDGPLPPNVQWVQGETWEMEQYVKACTATAGVVLGRTTLEGWVCGKPGWIYEVEQDGSIRSVDFYPPPHKDLLAQFDTEFMTDQLEVLYAEAIGDGRSLEELRAPRGVVLAFAEELVERPQLLAAWAAKRRAETLVIAAPDGDEAGWVAKLGAAFAAAGVSGDDVDAVLTLRAAGREAELAAGAVAVLGDRPLAELPRIAA